MTFHLPAPWDHIARSAQVLGDFNDWSTDSYAMNRLKHGGFSLTLALETNREYEFRYLLDGNLWLNEADADGTVPAHYGESVNSKIIL